MPRPYSIRVYVHKSTRTGHAITAIRDDRDGVAVMVSKRQLAALPELNVPSAGIFILENEAERRMYVGDSSQVVDSVLAHTRTHRWWQRVFLLASPRLPRSANINYLAMLAVHRLTAWCQTHDWQIEHGPIATTHQLPMGEHAAVENLLLDFEGALNVLGLSAFADTTDDSDD